MVLSDLLVAALICALRRCVLGRQLLGPLKFVDEAITNSDQNQIG